MCSMIWLNMHFNFSSSLLNIGSKDICSVVMSDLSFLWKGQTLAVFHDLGTIPLVSDLLSLVRDGARACAHSFKILPDNLSGAIVC